MGIGMVVSLGGNLKKTHTCVFVCIDLPVILFIQYLFISK